MIIEAKILELEGKVSLPDLHNEVVIEDGDQRVKYVADAFGIELSGAYVFGYFTLKRYDLEHLIDIKIERVSFLKYREVKVPNIRDKLIWIVNSSNYSSKMIVKYCHYKDIVEPSDNCRREIQSNAANVGLVLSERLLDLAFGPIEQQLCQKYRKIRDYGKSNPT